MIFIDANIPMYVTGADHPNKHASRALLDRLVTEGEPLCTSAEVIQEILHRFVAINRRDAIVPTVGLLLDLVGEVHSVMLDDVLAARDVVLSSGLSARDALHVSVMQRAGVSTIASFDTDFDTVAGIERITT